jgi:stearoyl-CoA desaturase (delta-9 desaturase)
MPKLKRMNESKLTMTQQVTGHSQVNDHLNVGKGPKRHRLTVRRLDWPVVMGIAAMHIGCLFAPFYFSWSGLVVAAVLAWLTAGMGITLGFHRLLTHRSFRTPKWFEYLLTTLGCLACQGGPIQWVGTHRLHHKHSDQTHDPHSPTHGFAWSHVFWCLQKNQGAMPWTACSAAQDLCRDPGMRLLNKWYILPQLLVIAVCYAGGQWAASHGWATSGWSWVIWGVAVRTVFVYHGTWFVNSAAHTWGYRNYQTDDNSTNLWWVALLSFGEGWHNNHHGDQRAASHGRRWFEFDMTYWTIRLLGLVGLARDIVPPRKKLAC